MAMKSCWRSSAFRSGGAPGEAASVRWPSLEKRVSPSTIFITPAPNQSCTAQCLPHVMQLLILCNSLRHAMPYVMPDHQTSAWKPYLPRPPSRIFCCTTQDIPHLAKRSQCDAHVILQCGARALIPASFVYPIHQHRISSLPRVSSNPSQTKTRHILVTHQTHVMDVCRTTNV